MSKKGGFLKGLGIGAAVAGIGALLFAPKSGKETREDIGKGFHRVGQGGTAEAVSEHMAG